MAHCTFAKDFEQGMLGPIGGDEEEVRTEDCQEREVDTCTNIYRNLRFLQTEQGRNHAILLLCR